MVSLDPFPARWTHSPWPCRPSGPPHVPHREKGRAPVEENVPPGHRGQVVLPCGCGQHAPSLSPWDLPAACTWEHGSTVVYVVRPENRPDTCETFRWLLSGLASSRETETRKGHDLS